MRGFPAMRPMTRGFGSFPFALCVLLLSRGVWASEPFDSVIKSELGLPPGPLLCLTCHDSLIGGIGTVNKRFGLAARKLGLQKLDVEKLKQVLQQMEATKVDSDCDGIGDIAELRTGSDPNSGETDAACADSVEPPRYGCSCSFSALSAKRGTDPSGTAFATGGLFVILLVARRSRRAVGRLRSLNMDVPISVNTRHASWRRSKSRPQRAW
jgi:hypothetical protein